MHVNEPMESLGLTAEPCVGISENNMTLCVTYQGFAICYGNVGNTGGVGRVVAKCAAPDTCKRLKKPRSVATQTCGRPAASRSTTYRIHSSPSSPSTPHLRASKTIPVFLVQCSKLPTRIRPSHGFDPGRQLPRKKSLSSIAAERQPLGRLLIFAVTTPTIVVSE